MTDLEFITAELDRLEALEKAATPGPWDMLGETGEVHAIEFVDGCGDPLHVVEHKIKEENAELICEARNALPRLVAALREALGIIECKLYHDYQRVSPWKSIHSKDCFRCNQIQRIRKRLEGKWQ